MLIALLFSSSSFQENVHELYATNQSGIGRDTRYKFLVPVMGPGERVIQAGMPLRLTHHFRCIFGDSHSNGCIVIT